MNEYGTTMRRMGVQTAFVFCSWGLVASAQIYSASEGTTPPVLAAGRPVGSYDLSGIENINLFGGGLSINIPLVRLPGEGALATPVVLSLRQRWILVSQVFGAQSHVPVPDERAVIGRQSYSPGFMFARVEGRDPWPSCSDLLPAGLLYRDVLTRLTFEEADGTQHEFVDALTGGTPHTFAPTQPYPIDHRDIYNCKGGSNARGLVWVTRDGSMMTFIADGLLTESGAAPSPGSELVASGSVSGYLYLKDGTRYRIVDGQVTVVRNRNGKQVVYGYGTDTNDLYSYLKPTSITDATGRTITILYNQAGIGDRFDRITFAGWQGANRTIEVHYCALTGTGCPNYIPATAATYATLFGYGSASTNYDPAVVSYVQLPDARRYVFAYNEYGEPVKVTLPTGGIVEYTHGPGSGTSSVIGATDSVQIYRRVKSRVTKTESGTVATRTVYKAEPSSGCPDGDIAAADWCTVVTEEQQSSAGIPVVLAATRHFFYGGADDPQSFFWGGRYFNYWNGREYKTELVNMIGQTNSSLAPTVIRTKSLWGVRACEASEICPGGVGLFPGSPVDTRLARTTRTLFDTAPNKSSYVEFAYDRFNNVTSKKEYGFQQELLRETISQFLTSQSVGSVVWDYVNLPLAGTAPIFQPNTFSGDYSRVVHIRDLQVDQQVASGGTIEAHVSWTYDGGTLESAAGTGQWDPTVPAARGNATTESHFSSAAVRNDIGITYYAHGKVKTRTDARGNSTQYTYGCNGMAVATVTDSLNRQTQIVPDCSTGFAATVSDANLVVESRDYTDQLDRPRSSSVGSYSKTQYNYNDAGRTIETLRDRNAYGDGEIRTEVVYDGLGRTIETRAYGPETAATRVQTRYDDLGRVWQVSNPFRGDAATAWTTTVYDSLGRVTSVSTDDGATTTSQYAGVTTTTTDPAGGSRVLTFDALGRMQSVEETGIGTASYSYSSLDLLTGVTQSGQNRRFVYDWQGRLVSAWNPETGLVCYGLIVNEQGAPVCSARYDGAGNLLNKTQGNGTVVTLSYDALNRLTAKSYSGAAGGVTEVGFVYDTEQNIPGVLTENRSLGRLTKVWSKAGSSTLSTSYYRYDGLGRVLASRQSTAGGGDWVFGYTHVPAGQSRMTYPSGRQVNWSYDSAGRVSAVKGSAGAPDYLSAVTYSPFGGVAERRLGNGLVEDWTYSNARGLVQRITLGQAAGASDTGEYRFGYCAGLEYNQDCASNNSNLRIAKNLVGATTVASQTYTYDGANRLKQVVEIGPDNAEKWRQTYVYDALGNRALLTGSSQPAAVTAPTVTQDEAAQVTALLRSRSGPGSSESSVTNQWLTADVDGAGNVTAPRSGSYPNTLIYDGENRVVSAVTGASGTFSAVYDGEGRRVAKTVNGVTTYSVYDAQGQLAAEYGGAASASAGRRYVMTDQLGSTRVVMNGATVEWRYDYMPYGEELAAGMAGRTTALQYRASPQTTADPLKAKFTGKERDSETGLDYFGARYFSAAQGRFTSPDPLIHPSSSPKGMVGFLSNLQNWNKYAYVINNPLLRIDPDGMADYLYIQSNVAKSTGASLTAGHANLVRYNTDTKRTTTYGLWPDSHPDIAGAGLANGKGSDVRTNFANDAPENYPLKYGVELTSDQSSKLDATVAISSEWGYTNTCATWASSTFTTVTGVKIYSSELAGATDTPRAIGDAINTKVATSPNSGVFPPGPAGAPGLVPKPTPPSSTPVSPTQPKRPMDDN